MAKQGFKVMDSDMHIMEPPDLWQRYIDPEFRGQAPVGVTSVNFRDLRTVFPGREPPLPLPGPCSPWPSPRPRPGLGPPFRAPPGGVSQPRRARLGLRLPARGDGHR